MVKKEKYSHCIANHGHLDVYINEIPRSINEGKIFSIKTFVLSNKYSIYENQRRKQGVY